MSGFSLEVAMAVTQPLWPSREPLKMRDSVLMMVVFCCDYRVIRCYCY